MTDTITIPPEAVAGTRAKLKVYFGGYQKAVIDEICIDAIRAALKAWPGMVHMKPSRRNPWVTPRIILPLPQEKQDD